MSQLALALLHYPVLDRQGRVITTAVTNLDLHDLARTGRTYGISRLYVVTPVAGQRDLAGRILGHWREGFGAAYNPDRREAFSRVEVAPTLGEAIAAWRPLAGAEPLPVLTGARRSDGISFEACRELARTRPLMLVFGTGWGLAPELFDQGWPVLAPVRGRSDYNHLPVRAAAAIILDRLCGEAD